MIAQAHSETMADSGVCSEQLVKLRGAQHQSWSKLEQLLQHNMCMIRYLAELQVA